MTSLPTRPTISTSQKLLTPSFALAPLMTVSSSSTTLQPSVSSTLSPGPSSTFLRYSPSPMWWALTPPKLIRSTLYDSCPIRSMRFIKKIVLSSPSVNNENSFIAVAILSETGILAYCKNGDQSWTFISDVGLSFLLGINPTQPDPKRSQIRSKQIRRYQIRSLRRYPIRSLVKD
jgi:hypothetical protein